MIQRKQTIWFLCSLILAILAFYIPFGEKATTSLGSYVITEHNLTANTNLLLVVLYGTLIALNFVSIMIFKRRDLQKVLAVISIILCLGILAYLVYFTTVDGNKLVFGISGSRIYLGILIPVFCLVFNVMAYSGVKADERLLKQSDRLR